MAEQTLRLGRVEATILAGLFVAASWMVSAVALGWFLWAIPGLLYGPLCGLLYAMYLVNRTSGAAMSVERRTPGPLPPAAARQDWRLAAASAFRVLEVTGSCPLQRSVGDVVLLSQSGHPSPPLCPGAATVLQDAARRQEAGRIEWRDAIGVHSVVFRLERATPYGTNGTTPHD